LTSSGKLDRRVRAWAEPSLLGLAALLFVVLVRYHFGDLADDAFIVFRYARNLTAGMGPVFNPGEAVEGFSSPLWLGLVAAGGSMGLPLPLWAGGLGVALLALCLAFVHRATLALCQSRLAAAAACAAATLIYPLHYWASAGLETALFAALVTATAWSLLASSPRGWAVAVACLGVARPEGPVLVIAALVGFVAVHHGRCVLRAHHVVLALAPTLLWLLFRRMFYGDWLPNTYYAKATGALVPRLEAGLLYSLWALGALATAAAAAWLARALDRRVLAVLAFAAVLLAMAVGEGGDWMWHGRLVAPVLPALVVIAAGAIARAPAQRKWVALVASVLAWSGFLPDPPLLADALAGGRLPPSSVQEGTLVQASFAAARFIADHYPKHAVVAVNHAGALPFAIENPVIDMTGLNDWHIAHQRPGGLHRKFDAAYVLSRKPDLVVLNSYTKPGTQGTWYHPGYWEGETALVAQPAWLEWYRPVQAFWEWRFVAGAPRYLVLFERAPPL
jgi:arabinofuranosyltransferase